MYLSCCNVRENKIAMEKALVNEITGTINPHSNRSRKRRR
jgi:hypothetical protein